MVQREHGDTQRRVLDVLRRNGQMTAGELSAALGIGPVGVRQHLAQLENEGLVLIAGVRRSVGRPSHLYELSPAAAALFPQSYDRLAIELLAFLDDRGPGEVSEFFAQRAARFLRQHGGRLAGDTLGARISALAVVLAEHGYMPELHAKADGSYELVQHNCPIQCVAQCYTQSCASELQLYERILGTPVTRSETIADGGRCCHYHIAAV